MKIALVNSGHIPFASNANVWLIHGFPLFFQGLLTVSGDEKGMIEDTYSTIESLNLFSVHVLKEIDPDALDMDDDDDDIDIFQGNHSTEI